MVDRILIVGAGQAAAQAIDTLRRKGFKGALTLVGAEPHLPYQRPPLSKKYLSGALEQERLLIRPAHFYAEHGVATHLARRADLIDRERRSVRLDDGSVMGYDILLLATGSKPRRMVTPGSNLAGVHYLRNIADVERIRPDLVPGKRLVIVGGGYIGLEVAAVARGEGRDVTVLEAEERVMKRVTSPVISEFMQHFHRGRGVDIRLGARLAAIEGDGKVSQVRLADGSPLAADLVLLAVGAKPNDDLAAAAGLPCADGIVVDENGQTADAAIWAAGDCTRFPSKRYGRKLRLECVQNAIDQAKAVATALLDKPQAYDPVPWFWSDQYELKLQMAGLSDGYDDAKTVGDVAAARFSVEYRKNGKLIAVDAVNDGRAYMSGRKRIAEETAAP
jgi:3-phenylpropionate/trans-cinnamate dioxygenase ferredoxin reductase component